MELVAEPSSHRIEFSELGQVFETDVRHGLSRVEAESRHHQSGPNELAGKPPPPWWTKLLGQFSDLVIWILLVAAALSALLGDWLEAAAILAIVALNALLGFVQEQRAERALHSLKKLSAPNAKVIRDGLRRTIAARNLVPGDLVEIESGDHVPADLRLIKTFCLTIQEAPLTGESVPVEKDAAARVMENAAIGDRTNMAFTGTTTVAGKGLGIVAAIGMHTELGRIAGFLQSEKTDLTPLQKRLAELGRVLIVACFGLVMLTSVLQLIRGEHLAQTILVALSLAVAAVPEGLPAVVTVALALGLQRMVRRNALIRRLASVETLGCVTVICSDKTGTLTRNEMTVTDIVTGSTHYRVTGAGYSPEGEFIVASPTRSLTADTSHSNNGKIDPANEPDLRLALTIGLWCNNARLERSSRNGKHFEIFGDPTEGALLVAARKAKLERNGRVSLVDELPFDSDRKLMSVMIDDSHKGTFIYTKGAPEAVLNRCQFEHHNGNDRLLTPERREEILHDSRNMAQHALRLLAVAYRQPENRHTLEEHDLVFAGLIGMMDPPRTDAQIAVAKCKSAGIRPMLITGDHPATGLAVARELDIADEKDRGITGSELDELSDEQLSAALDNVAVYARVSPEHKFRLVKTLETKGEVVAMTGDGVNDAPAVKMADIGIAMGITGTDVTKDASDMVLMDDNFASIVNAVEEGRGIYDNIQKFVHYLLSCNASEIALILVAAIIGWPVPLLPIQILWINLITDGLPALALAMEKPEPNVMNRPPRPPNEPFFNRARGTQILSHGALMAFVTIGGFGYAYFSHGLAYAQAMAFHITTFTQLFFAFACRSQRYTVPQLGLFTNPYLLVAVVLSGLLQVSLMWLPFTRSVFFASPPQFGFDWISIFVLAITPLTIVEVAKMLRRPAK